VGNGGMEADGMALADTSEHLSFDGLKYFNIYIDEDFVVGIMFCSNWPSPPI
jgi:hypothetical protein